MQTNGQASEIDPATRRAMANRNASKACEHLLGMVDGMLADDHLHDREIQFLSAWLTEHRPVCEGWPLYSIGRMVRAALADGVITDEERSHLKANLQALIGSPYATTGWAGPDVAPLPIEDAVTVRLTNASLCFTGEFLFGTRAACERASLRAGAVIADGVTRQLDYLIIGTRVSPDWAHSSFGRKIQRAAELQESGCELEIISEHRWLEALEGK